MEAVLNVGDTEELRMPFTIYLLFSLCFVGILVTVLRKKIGFSILLSILSL